MRNRDLCVKTKKERKLQVVEGNKRAENTIVWDKLCGRDNFRDTSIVDYCYAVQSVQLSLKKRAFIKHYL